MFVLAKCVWIFLFELSCKQFASQQRHFNRKMTKLLEASKDGLVSEIKNQNELTVREARNVKCMKFANI